MPVRDSMLELEPVGLCFRVQGVEWHYQAKGYIMLHKPAGTECSQKPSAWPKYSALCCRSRCASGLAKGPSRACKRWGRLDQDTTGLLLLSDDGQFIHRMSSPKKHVPKVYQGDGQASNHSAHGGAFVCGSCVGR